MEPLQCINLESFMIILFKMKNIYFRVSCILLIIVSISITLVSCDGMALVELPDQKIHDTTYVTAPDTIQRSPINPLQKTFYYDINKQAFGFTSLDSMQSLYFDYTRVSGGYTYLKTGQNTADLDINFVQRNVNTYYFDVYDFALTFQTPYGGTLSGTQIRTIKTLNPNTLEFTTQSITTYPVENAKFSLTLWIALVREGL